MSDFCLQRLACSRRELDKTVSFKAHLFFVTRSLGDDVQEFFVFASKDSLNNQMELDGNHQHVTSFRSLHGLQARASHGCLEA